MHTKTDFFLLIPRPSPHLSFISPAYFFSLIYILNLYTESRCTDHPLFDCSFSAFWSVPGLTGSLYPFHFGKNDRKSDKQASSL